MPADTLYTAEILRERADLRTRRPTRIQLQDLSARYDGKPVRSMGIVREVENVGRGVGAGDIRVVAYDEAGGEEVRYDVRATFLKGLSPGPNRGQFQRWTKGQKVVVEGKLEWPDADGIPVVNVTGIRYT